MGSKNNIKGLTVEISGDVTELSAALNTIDKDAKKSSDELREINRLLKLDPKNTELLVQKAKVLSDAIGKAKEKLDVLRSAEETAREQFERGEIGAEQFRALQRETIKAAQSLERLERDYSEIERAAKDAGEAVEDSGEDAAEAAKDTEKLNDALGKLTGKYDDAKEAAKDSAKEFAATAAAGAAAVGVALNAAMSQEDALASIQAQTGKSAEDMQKIASAMDSVYRAGYGEDLDDVASTVATIAQLTGRSGNSELSELAKDAIALRDAFGYETQESIRGAKMLVDQFGIGYRDAFELVAQGTQNGLNRSGDLLDIINEYSVHYKSLGYSAEEFFGSLQSGAEAGAFSVDKLGDATKEFGIRTKDNSEATKEAFARLHLDADVMSEKFAAGGDSAREASEIVLGALLRMRDQVAQNEVGVALFGTMWEDLGVDAVAAMTDVSGSIDLTKGKLEEIKEVKYDTVSTQWKKLGREVQTELIAPIGEDLLPLAQKFCSYLTKNLDDLLPTIKGIATTAASMFVGNKVGNMVKSVVKLVQAYKSLKTATTAANAAMATTPWGAVGAAIGLVVGGIISLINAENEAAEAERERVRALKQAADEQTAAYREIAESARDSAEARREAARAVNEEFDRYGELWRELEKLVDAEGNVIAGNEDRVEQIRGELSDAMGEEIELVDGQIQKYGELRDTIADTLALKRVEALTQEYKGDYDTAKSDLHDLQMQYEAANSVVAYGQSLYDDIDVADRERDAWIAAHPEEYESYMQFRFTDPTYLSTQEKMKEFDDRMNAYDVWRVGDGLNAAENARLARESYDQAVATIAQYEALTAAMYSGDTKAMLAAAEAMENGIIKSAHGVAYSTLYAQAEDLHQSYQALAAASQSPGSTITQAQLDDAAELVAQAVYEAYVAARAEGTSQEELDALRSMLLQGYDFGTEQFVYGVPQPVLASFDRLISYLDNQGGLASTIEHGSDALQVELGAMVSLLQGVAASIAGLDFTVTLDGEILARKLGPHINHTLGDEFYLDTRGSLSAR